MTNPQPGPAPVPAPVATPSVPTPSGDRLDTVLPDTDLPDTSLPDTAARVAAIHDYAILDTLPEPDFDDIVQLIAATFDAPIALVSLITDDRQWFKAEIGAGMRETTIDVSICAHTIRQNELLVVPDMLLDARFVDNALVTAEGIRFYAGALLRTPDGLAIGTLCVLDRAPRPDGITARQRLTLEILARQVMTQLELRRAVAVRDDHVAERSADFDRMWNATEDLLVIAEADGTLIAVNRAWTKQLGWAEDRLVGAPLAEFTHPEDLDATLNAFGGIVETGVAGPYEYRLLHADGSYRWFAWTGVFEDGQVFANGRAVTAERAQRAALRAAEDALRQSQKMEAVGQLTGGLAHDFNNMLAGISGSLELIQVRLQQGRLADVERYVIAAQGASRRAAALTHRLLAFSRRQTLAPKPTDANRLIQGMEDMVRRTVGPGIELETALAGGLWSMLVDQGQMENALLNLCINARDAMPQGGRIVIETANRWLDARAARERELDPGQYVSLCVSDNGTGMSADVIEKAFDPFFTTKPIGEGTGLGLSMIYGFVRQSAGQVRIYSEAGQGTMVCLYIPRGDVVPEEARADATPEPERAERGETVLVVDDEATIRMLVIEVLQDLGYATLEAHDGPAAMRVLDSDARIDLLVTDVGLPGGMNGRQIADAARARRPGLKALFITGYAENAALSHGHLGSGMHVLTKPFAMDALTARVHELLSTG